MLFLSDRARNPQITLFFIINNHFAYFIACSQWKIVRFLNVDFLLLFFEDIKNGFHFKYVARSII
jgi:hypothetical protein